MTTSGTYNFDLSNSDIVFEAYDRIQIRGTMVTGDHMISARTSLNLSLATFSIRGVNLWAIDLQTIPLIQGITQYQLPPSTVLMLDTYIETYQLTTTVNQAPNFTTTLGSATVNVGQTNHGMIAGQWLNIVTPVAIGGILLSGFYQVVTVINVNNYTITAASAATSSVIGAGTLATFTTATSSSTIAAVLANHGLNVGSNFYAVSTAVGGLTISGNYTVVTVADSSHFTFIASGVALTAATVTENSNQVQIQVQGTADPIDRILKPLSRTDYAMIPDKVIQGPPTACWYDRVIPPVVNLWPAPDGNGPYALKFYRLRRLQDANLGMGETADVTFRHLDALCADVTARLAEKYQPAVWKDKMIAAKMAWDEAYLNDRERVEVSIRPDFSGYYR